MAEISATGPAIPPSALPRPVVAATDMALKLLQPLDGLMRPGESARAEVMTVREQSQSFQVVLKLTLDSGREALLQASTNKPLDLGSAVVVSALSPTRLLAALQPMVGRPLTALDTQQIPIGTLLQAKVVATQPLPSTTADSMNRAAREPAQQQVVVQLLNGPQPGVRLALQTHLQLPVGSLLTAQVQGPQTLSFLPPSSRLEQLDISQQLNQQQTRQGSLEGLLKTLANLPTSALASTPASPSAAMPEAVRGAIDRLLAALPDVAQLSTPKGIQQAITNSGQFLEARLLANPQEPLTQDLKANLLRLVAQILPSTPGLLPTLHAGVLAQALPALLRDVLGQAGAQVPRQAGLSFPLPSRLLQNMDTDVDLELLLKLAAAAVSRLQTHQLSSLAQTQSGPEGSQLTTWQLEIPMRNQQELVPLQLKIQSEEKPEQPERKQKAETLWRLELAFDIDPLGPLQVQAQLAQGAISSQLWAERASTTKLINGELGHLRERLTACGLVVAELACRQGTPPQGPKTQVEQRWVDETA